MSEKKKYSGALFTFYVLVIYAVLQFLWWSFLLVKQSNELYQKELTLNSAFMNPAQSQASKPLLARELQKTWYMVVGEGTVFLCIMFLGVMRVKRSYRQERELQSKQNAFLHSITHEFKSPVASLRIQLETMLMRNLTRDQQIKTLNNSLEDTDRLDLLIEKTLTAARIDYGEIPIMEEFMNLSVRLNELIAKIGRKNPDRIIVTNIQNDVFMKMDPWALESIVTNLLENAFIYSPADKSVIVSLKWEANMVTLTVKDQGIGIPDKDKQQVFWKFYRTDATAGYKGTGLGLFLVDYFVKKFFGTIVIKDNTPEGSIFEITFPTHNNP